MSNYEEEIKNRVSGDWVRQTFFRSKLGGADEHVSKLASSSEINFYDTSPGGNRSINCQHQFTDHCDPRPLSGITDGDGMGRYYNEAIDNNAQRVSFSFGIAEYNSLSTFFTYAYDSDAAAYVTSGEGNGFFFTTGKVLGTLFTLPIQAIFGLEALYHRIKAVATNTPYSKFYYMRPTMPLYWSAVSIMVNQLTGMMGVTSGYTEEEVGDDGNFKGNITQADVTALNRTLPDIAIGDKGTHGIDVIAMSTRAQRRANAFEENMATAMESLGSNATFGAVQAKIAEVTNNPISYKPKVDIKTEEYLRRYIDSDFAKGTSTIGVSKSKDESNPTTPTNNLPTPPREKGLLESFADEFQAQVRDGSAFVTFEVQHTGAVSESFSNTTKESAISSTVNGITSGIKDMKFNFAGGNFSDGVMGSIGESILGAVSSLLGGVLDSVGLDGVNTPSQYNIPEQYDTSSSEIGNTQYTMVLSTPYGNKMSILMDIYVPLCMILAGALPRSTGKNTYDSPFLCRAFHQGTGDVKTGIIESINITRGNGNVGLNTDRMPTSIEVSFTVKNLDPIMHMPIKESLADRTFGLSHFDEPDGMSDYMSTLSAMSLSDSFYLKPRIKLAWEKTKLDWASTFSVSRMAQTASNTLPGHIWRVAAKASSLYD